MALQRRKYGDGTESVGSTQVNDYVEPGGVTGGVPVVGSPMPQNAGLPGGTAGPNQPTPPVPAPYQAGQYAGQLGGFEPSKYGKQDKKYVFGAHADDYDFGDWANNKAGLLKDLQDDPSGLFKGASWDKDALNLGNGEEFNVAGEHGYQWNPSGAANSGMGAANASGQPLGAGGAPIGGGGSTPQFGDLKSALAGLFPDGAFNQGIVTKRVSNAADTLARQRKSSSATNRAQLAERGLIGSGAEGSASENLDSRLFDTYASNVNDIYASEGQAADQRMMQALQISAGMTEAEAATAVQALRAQNDFTLGQGSLANQGRQIDNTFNLGLGQFGLDQDRLNYDMQHGNIDQWIALIQQMMNGAGTSAGGHI